MPLPADLPEAGFSGAGDSVFPAAVREDPKPKITFNRALSGTEPAKDIFTDDDSPGFLKNGDGKLLQSRLRCWRGCIFGTLILPTQR